MRLWLNRTAEVSLREQLTAQIRLGILCRELVPGERLPSTRELARRFGIHANTASAAYRELERDGWVEFRHGSGVYVRATRPAAPRAGEGAVDFAVDALIGELMAKARKLGAPPAVVHARLRQWEQMEPPARWLVIEPDPELRRIVIAELEPALSLPVAACAPEDCGAAAVLDGAMPAVLPSKAAAVRKLLPPGRDLTVLEVHPVAPELQAYLQRYLPEHASDLIGIASRWEEFQRLAKIMLIAAGLSPASLLVRDAARPGWRRGLTETAAVVCDAMTAPQLPRGCFAIVFRLFDHASIDKLRQIEARVTEARADLTPAV
jgi:DNA-binding transcriptional regulator YhcF (GntR family)